MKIVQANVELVIEIVEENNYYPFGLKHKGYNSFSISSNLALNYKFGGKEYNEELGLDWYDVSARNYDPALGRWMNLDPLAEQMRRHSPYNYAFDNPVYFIDPDGMKPFPGWPTTITNYVKGLVGKDNSSTSSVSGVMASSNMARPNDGPTHDIAYDEITFFKGGGAKTMNKILQVLKKGMDKTTAALDMIDLSGSGSNPESTETVSEESSTQDTGTVDSNNEDGDVGEKKVKMEVSDFTDVSRPGGSNDYHSYGESKKDTSVYDGDQEKVLNMKNEQREALEHKVDSLDTELRIQRGR